MFNIKTLTTILLFKAAVIIGIILYAGIGLGPDEAQYWTWSQALDWGYYSKPPGIAWQIWLGTALFGSTELGVRIGSVVLSFFQALAVYFLAIECGLIARIAFWSALIMAFCPMGLIGSFLATTDGGSILFWTLACAVLASGLKKNEEASPIAFGTLIACGALFKWTCFFLWVPYILFRTLYFPRQSILKGLTGAAISLIGQLPSLWWNISHDWATFRHVGATLQGGSVAKAGGNFWEFIGSQALLLSPILFVMLLLAFRNLIRQRRTLSPPLLLCGMITLACLTGAATLALFQKVQGNWILFAYPTGFVVIGWAANQWQEQGLRWLKGGLVLSVSLTALAFSALLPFRISPWKHNLGWAELSAALKEAGYNPEEHFLVSDKYQTTSLLSFYSEAQKRAYFLNLHGIRKNQFSYWPGLPQEQKGQSGFFIMVENAPHLQREEAQKSAFYDQELPKYFEKVDSLGTKPLLYDVDGVSKAALIYKCTNCTDRDPEISNKY